MSQVRSQVHGAQSRLVPATHNRRKGAPPQQQIRERLELQAITAGAGYDLAQLAADAWLRRIATAPATDWEAAEQATAAWLQGVAL